MTAKTMLITGSIHGFLAVALGAFGAHAFKEHLSANQMTEVYQTGVHYQMNHALALVLLALLTEKSPENALLRRAGALFFAGILLFSGSLVLLALSGVRILGAITPLGGLCFLAGWILLTVAAAQKKERLL